MEATRIVLAGLGIEPGRFASEWVSAAEGPRFAEVVTRFVTRVRELGPNPRRLAAAAA